MAVSYQLRAEYVGKYAGGVITYGPYGTSFDIGAALTAGGGTITTGDEALVQQLDRYPPLFRSGFTGDPTPTIAPRFRAVSVGNAATTTDVVLEAHLPNEAYARWQMLGDGSQAAGTGAVPATVLPSASGLSTLALGGTIRGTWAAATAYALNDVVLRSGVLYRALSAHTSGGTFDLTYWTTLYPDADRTNGQEGMYAGPADIATVSTAALVSGRAYLLRMCPSRDMTIGSIAFAVTTASGTNDPVDVGIYDAGLVRIVSSGATTGKLNSTGPKTVTIASTALTAGAVYYVALSAASTATVGTLSMANSNMVQLFGASAPAVEMDRSSTDTIHPLTSSITSSGGTSVCPLLAVREV